VFYLLGSTGASVLWALLTSLALVFVVRLLHDKQKKDIDKIHKKRPSEESAALTEEGRGAQGEEVPRGQGEVEMRKLEDAGTQLEHVPGVDETDHTEVKVDFIGAYLVREWHGKALRHLGAWGYITLLSSLLAFILALMSLLWAVALSYYHTNRVEKNISAFALVEFLAGILLPVLLIVGSTLLAIVMDYITIGRVDARKRINRFLPSVMFEEGAKSDYWVIENRFYFKLDKRDNHFSHTFCYSCDKTPSTWLLTCIVALSILLCLSYFVDITVVEEETLSACPLDFGEFDCFNGSSFNFVDCGNEEQRNYVELVHCFRFLRFAVDTSLITSLAQAFAFYLATVAVFGRVFSIVKALLHLHRTRLWGILFLVVGTAAFIITVVFLIVEDRFQIQVNVLSVLQVLMACAFIFLVGVLILLGDWYEKIFDHKKTPLPQLLLHYGTSISTPEVQEIEHAYATKLKKADPTTAHSVAIRDTSI
jgi:hypothetical protein